MTGSAVPGWGGAGTCEVPLQGGAANYGLVVRNGDTVRRPLRPHSPVIHALLQHLEAVGFDRAPRFLGIDDQGREVLTWVEGEVPLPPLPAWARAEGTALRVARLLRDLHEATAGFRAPDGTAFDSHVLAPWNAGSTICHNDVVRSNVVFRDGYPVALIDYDLAAPAATAWELGCAIQQWIPLRGEEDPDDEVAGRRTARRIREFCDAYGLPADQRPDVLEVITASEAAGARRLRELVEAGHPAYIELWNGGAAQRIEQRRVWLQRHRETLLNALRDEDHP